MPTDYPPLPEPYAWFWQDGSDCGVVVLRQDYEHHKATYPRMTFVPVVAADQMHAYLATERSRIEREVMQLLGAFLPASMYAVRELAAAREDIIRAIRGERACRKCGGQMIESTAIEQTYTGSPDDLGGDVATMSPGGPGKMVPCLKCRECGWSVTC